MFAGLAAHHLDQCPGDELLQLAEWLLLEDVAHLTLPRVPALAQHELAHRAEARRRRLEPFLIERLVMLDGRQPGQFFPSQAEDAAHLVVEIGAVGKRRELLPSQQLRDVRLRHLGLVSQIALIETELFQTAADDERKVHRRKVLGPE